MKRVIFFVSLFFIMANGNEIEKNTNCSIGTIMDKISMLARVSNLTISQKIKESDTKQRFRIEAGESRDGVVTFINPRVGDRLIRQDKANPADLSVEVEVYRDSLNQTVISYKNPSKLKSPNYNAYINAKIDRLDRELCKITSMALAQTCVGFKSEF